jgi:hypothetical protein
MRDKEKTVISADSFSKGTAEISQAVTFLLIAT